MIGILNQKGPFRPSGLVSELRMTAIPPGNRGTLIDRAGGGNPGTIYGRPALRFNAAEVAETAAQFGPTGTKRYFHFAGRFKVTASAATRCLLDIEFGAGDTGAQWVNVSVAGDDTVAITVRGASGDTPRTAAGDALAEGAWTDLAVEIDAQADEVTIAIDGVIIRENEALSGGSISGFSGDNMSQARFGLTDAGADQYAGYMNYIGFGWDDTVWTAEDYERFHDFPATVLADKFGSGDAEYWLCDEGAGNPVGEGKTITLTLTGTDWDMGAHGGGVFSAGAMTFDKVDDYVSMPDAANLRFSGGGNDLPFSLVVWATVQPGAVNQYLCSKFDANGLREWLFRVDSIERVTLRLLKFDDSATAIAVLTDGAHADGTLKLYIATYDGSKSENGLNIYIDGATVADSVAKTGAYTGMTAGAAPLAIGVIFNVGSPLNFLGGSVTSVQVYNRELTALEAKALFNQGAHR